MRQALFMRFNTLITIRTPYRRLRQIFSDKQLKLIRRKSITALTHEATKQNIFK